MACGSSVVPQQTTASDDPSSERGHQSSITIKHVALHDVKASRGCCVVKSLVTTWRSAPTASCATCTHARSSTLVRLATRPDLGQARTWSPKASGPAVARAGRTCWGSLWHQRQAQPNSGEPPSGSSVENQIPNLLGTIWCPLPQVLQADSWPRKTLERVNGETNVTVATACPAQWRRHCWGTTCPSAPTAFSSHPHARSHIPALCVKVRGRRVLGHAETWPASTCAPHPGERPQRYEPRCSGRRDRQRSSPVALHVSPECWPRGQQARSRPAIRVLGRVCLLAARLCLAEMLNIANYARAPGPES